jgi:anti-anti-sigma factor
MDTARSHPHSAHHVQRFLWAVGEAQRRRRERAAIAARSATAPAVVPTIPAAGAAGQGLMAEAASDNEGSLEICLAVRGGRVNLSLVGKLDWRTVPWFVARVSALIDEGARSIVVDLGGAEVVDRHGAAALLSASTLLDQRKGEMVLKSPRSDTIKLLGVTGLGHQFIIC